MTPDIETRLAAIMDADLLADLSRECGNWILYTRGAIGADKSLELAIGQVEEKLKEATP